ncbi:hypothetical protein BDZ89DRAFT_1073508 [Hymenopellis radicata]|nr:hypothetical protein BDZ89DRAFT_1073508 [Hymenopellis radicata]
MSPKSAPNLPPELIELIVEHLRGDCLTLRNCALISRAWTAPSQRALFHDTRWCNFREVFRLPAHFRLYPHLQRLIQHLHVRHAPRDTEIIWQRNKYLSSLAASFPLIPHVTSLDITFDRSRPWDAHDRLFVEAFGAFLRQSECLTALAVHGLRDQLDFRKMFSLLNGTMVQRLSLGTMFYNPYRPIQVDFFDTTLSVACLPAVELLQINPRNAFELSSGLKFWLSQQRVMFPNLKHCEFVANDSSDLVMWLRDIMQSTALQLESLRLGLNHCSEYLFDTHYSGPPTFGLLEGLHVKHFMLCIYEPGLLCYEVQIMIDWFSLIFRSLADSGSAIHFTELTFTFTKLTFAYTNPDIEGIPGRWATLDEVLSHAAFSGVQRIHFEKESEERTLITDQAHPELASTIRRTLPCLASRGVLCFS